jgi:hypothetical protein
MGFNPIHLAIAGRFTDNCFSSFLIGARITGLLTFILRINKNVIILQVGVWGSSYLWTIVHHDRPFFDNGVSNCDHLPLVFKSYLSVFCQIMMNCCSRTIRLSNTPNVSWKIQYNVNNLKDIPSI